MAKFEIGDKVVVKHSNEDGQVEEILNDKMVLVNVRGVRFPAYTDQLDFPYFKQFKKERELQKSVLPKKYIEDVKREKPAPKYQIKAGVWLLLFPVFEKDVFEDDIVEGFKIYLVNQTEEGLKFRFWLKFKGIMDTELQSEVLSLSDFYLMDIPFEHLNDGPSFDFEFSLLSPDKKRVPYFEASYKPKGKALFKQVEHLRIQGNSFFDQLLFAAYPTASAAPVESLSMLSTTNSSLDKLAAAGFKVVNNKRLPLATPPPPSVIDLHIEKLIPNFGALNASEILDFQLKTFEKWLEAAQEHYLKQAWIIHGIGTGRLRDEVQELLRRRAGVKYFVQQYHPWYGNGATEVFFE